MRLLVLARDARPRRDALERLADLVIPSLSCVAFHPAASADFNRAVTRVLRRLQRRRLPTVLHKNTQNPRRTANCGVIMN